MLPILNLFLAPAVSVAVLMWVDMFANVQLLPGVRRDSTRAVIIPLTLGTLVAMPAGAYVLLTVDPVLMKRVICGAILAAALVLLTGWRYRRAVSARVYAAVGALSGFVMGATSIAAITPLFLSAGNHSALENRANFVVWVFLATVLLIVILAVRGTLGAGDATKIAVLTPAYLAGIVIGSRLVRSTSDQTVRRAVLALIITVALAGLIL